MPQKTYVVDFGERVDPTVLAVVPPLVRIVGNVLQ